MHEPDLIGIISDVGPFDFAGRTSKKKNRKIQIRNLEYVSLSILHMLLSKPYYNLSLHSAPHCAVNRVNK